MEQIPFVSSTPNTLGIELELQLINASNFDLTGAAEELLAQVSNQSMADRIKPEITRAMIELNSSVHDHPAGLLVEMREMRDALCTAADAIGVRVAGGGAHPFMRWQDRSISDTPRFQYLAEMYGYLARQFTVFGQHIHVGVASGDDAIGLTRRLTPYVPHLIAMSASSPYCEGVDTLFSCCRLHSVSSFPLSGHIPVEIRDWYGFEAHAAQLRNFGLADSIKDLYWDIRPKPDFGTVEVRVCDTPLTVDKACQLAAFVQALAVSTQRLPAPGDGAWLAYRTNHHQACRFGLHGNYVSADGSRMRLADHLRQTFERLMPVADELGTADMVAALRDDVQKNGNDARWMRSQYNRLRDLPGVVEAMTHAFQGGREAGAQQATLEHVANRRRIRATSEPLHPVQQLAKPEAPTGPLH